MSLFCFFILGKSFDNLAVYFVIKFTSFNRYLLCASHSLSYVFPFTPHTGPLFLLHCPPDKGWGGTNIDGIPPRPPGGPPIPLPMPLDSNGLPSNDPCPARPPPRGLNNEAPPSGKYPCGGTAAFALALPLPDDVFVDSSP